MRLAKPPCIRGGILAKNSSTLIEASPSCITEKSLGNTVLHDALNLESDIMLHAMSWFVRTFVMLHCSILECTVRYSMQHAVRCSMCWHVSAACLTQFFSLMSYTLYSIQYCILQHNETIGIKCKCIYMLVLAHGFCPALLFLLLHNNIAGVWNPKPENSQA